MGLSSSQARLLNLTSRMHQIEYKAAKLEAEKLQMANESRQVYDTYLEALEKTKIQYKVLSTDGSVTYQDVQHYDDFLAAGYAINFDGTVYDGSDRFIADGTTYVPRGTVTPTATEVTAGGKYYGLTLGYKYFVYNDGQKDCYSTTQLTENATAKLKVIGSTDVAIVANTLKKETMNYAQLCADAFGADLSAPPANVAEVITNLINSGSVTLVQARKDNTFAIEIDKDYNIFETSVATSTGLQEVTDSSNLKKAEAKYEADMKKIDMKDRKYDHDLAALDAERNAIKSEMETLKNVAKENVERTFKLFS